MEVTGHMSQAFSLDPGATPSGRHLTEFQKEYARICALPNLVPGSATTVPVGNMCVKILWATYDGEGEEESWEARQKRALEVLDHLKKLRRIDMEFAGYLRFMIERHRDAVPMVESEAALRLTMVLWESRKPS